MESKLEISKFSDCKLKKFYGLSNKDIHEKNKTSQFNFGWVSRGHGRIVQGDTRIVPWERSCSLA